MKIEFKLYGQGGAIVAVDHLMQKSCGLVAVGEVTTGVLTEGDMVSFKKDDEDVLYDKCKRIEINYTKVAEAEAGQLIGICFDNISKEELVKYFE